MSSSCYTLNQLAVPLVDHSVTKLLYVSVARYSREWNSMLHTHHCTEVFLVTGGNGYLCTAKTRTAITVDDVIIVNPNTEHTEISSDKLPLEYIVMGVDGMELLWNEESTKGYSILHFHSEKENLLFCMRSMLWELENKFPGYDTVCQDFLEIILLKLMRHSEFSVAFVPSLQKSSRECALVKQYIDQHFKDNLTLDDLAIIAHVSKYYLVHSFSREYGTSPINYLMSCRIKESLHLLTDTRMPLSQIAGVLGFSSPSYFSQSFRRLQGMSPLEYRKRGSTSK